MSTRKSADALGLVLDVTNTSDRTPDNDRIWHRTFGLPHRTSLLRRGESARAMF